MKKVGSWETEDRRRETEDRSQKWEVGRRETEAGNGRKKVTVTAVISRKSHPAMVMGKSSVYDFSQTLNGR